MLPVSSYLTDSPPLESSFTSTQLLLLHTLLTYFSNNLLPPFSKISYSTAALTCSATFLLLHSLLPSVYYSTYLPKSMTQPTQIILLQSWISLFLSSYSQFTLFNPPSKHTPLLLLLICKNKLPSSCYATYFTHPNVKKYYLLPPPTHKKPPPPKKKYAPTSSRQSTPLLFINNIIPSSSCMKECPFKYAAFLVS